MAKHSEILLLQDVNHVGRSGDICRVRSGYARNFLIPSQVAIYADANAKRMQGRLQEERAKQAARDKAESEVIAKRIGGLSFSMEVKIDPEGHMYGSVSQVDLARLLAGEGIVIDRKCISLAHPIKHVGTHYIVVVLKEGVTAGFTINVHAEGQSAPVEA